MTQGAGPSGFIGEALETLLNQNKYGEKPSDLCSAITKLVKKLFKHDVKIWMH